MADDTDTKATEPALKDQLLKLAVEVGPLVVFFVVNCTRRHLLGHRRFHGRDRPRPSSPHASCSGASL